MSETIMPILGSVLLKCLICVDNVFVFVTGWAVRIVTVLHWPGAKLMENVSLTVAI